MTIAFAPYPVPFHGGIDTKSDPKSVLPPFLRDLQNVVYMDEGTMAKRPGSRRLGETSLDGAALPTARALATRGDELLRFSDDRVHTYDESVEKWADRGALESITPRLQTIAFAPAIQRNASCATASGVTAYAWEDSRSSSSVRYALYDEATGAAIVADTELSATGEQPRVIAIGAALHIYFWDNGSLYRKTILTGDVVTSAATAAVQIATDGHTTAVCWDIFQLGSDGYFAYRTATPSVKFGRLAASGSLGTSVTIVEDPARGITIAPEADADRLYVGWCTTAAARFAVYTASALTQVAAPAAHASSANLYEITAAWDAAASCHVFWEERPGTASVARVYKEEVSIAGVRSGALDIRRAGIASGAFRESASVYVMLVYESTLQSTYFLYRDDLTLLGKVLPTEAEGLHDKRWLERPVVTDRVAAWMAPFKRRLKVEEFLFVQASGGSTPPSQVGDLGLKRLDLDFGDLASHRAVEIGRAAYVSGLQLWQYDGGPCPVEAGFHLYPEGIPAPVAGAVRSTPAAVALETASSSVDGTAFATGAQSFVVGRVYLIGVCGRRLSSAVGQAPSTIAGSGISFTKIEEEMFSEVIQAADLSWWRATVSSPTTAALTITYANSHSAVLWSIVELTSMDTSGSNGSGCIVQSKKDGSATTQTTFSTTLTNPLESASNLTLAVFGSIVNNTFSAGSGYTILGQDTETLASGGLVVESKTGATVADITETGPSGTTFGAIVLEIKGQVLSAIPAGTYSYRAYTGWTNDKGETELSSTAQTIVVTLASTSKVTLTLPSLTHTLKKGSRVNAFYVITRSRVNPFQQSPLYRCSSSDPTATGDNGWVWNDPTADTVTFVDNMLDDTLKLQQQDYLSSGELDHLAPPVGTILAAGKERLYVAGFEDQNKVLASMLKFDGQGVAFNENLEIIVDTAGGPITALEVMDERLIVWKRDRTSIVIGDGPNNLGQGGWEPAQRVTGDVGCIDQRSVAQTPLGIVFQSAKGIRLIDRALSVSYLGLRVERFNDQTVTAAVALVDDDLILFLTDEGRALVYDYTLKAWSTWTGYTATDAALWRNQLARATPDGRVLVKDDDLSTDDGVTYRWLVEFPHLQAAGPQGFLQVKRILALGQYHSPHKLRGSVGYDMEPTYEALDDFDPAGVVNTTSWGSGTSWGSDAAWGGSGSAIEQVEFSLPRQKCFAFGFKLEEVPSSTPGRAFTLVGLVCEIARQRGAYRLREAVKVTASRGGGGGGPGGGPRSGG